MICSKTLEAHALILLCQRLHTESLFAMFRWHCTFRVFSLKQQSSWHHSMDSLQGLLPSTQDWQCYGKWVRVTHGSVVSIASKKAHQALCLYCST